MSKVIIHLDVVVWESLLRIQFSVFAIAVQLLELKTTLKGVPGSCRSMFPYLKIIN